MVANVAFNWILMHWLGVRGIALSTTAVNGVMLGALAFVLFRNGRKSVLNRYL